jgi:hypothetical protein
MECQVFCFLQTSFLKAFASLVALMIILVLRSSTSVESGCWQKKLGTGFETSHRAACEDLPMLKWQLLTCSALGKHVCSDLPGLDIRNQHRNYCGAGYEMEWAKAQIPHLVFLKRLVNEQVWQIKY